MTVVLVILGALWPLLALITAPWQVGTLGSSVTLFSAFSVAEIAAGAGVLANG